MFVCVHVEQAAERAIHSRRQARTPIWQSKHVHHMNRNVLNKLWKEIAELFPDMEDDVTPELNEGNLDEPTDGNSNDNERSPTPQSIAGSSTSTQYTSTKRKQAQDLRQEFMELEKKKLDLLQIKLSQSTERQEPDCEDLLFSKVHERLAIARLQHNRAQAHLSLKCAKKNRHSFRSRQAHARAHSNRRTARSHACACVCAR
ncbi:hypothetical protein EVAR_85182_1 [Eumeta japonica]|uniref:MADF domain-containing protein n=1 Tax=Eumeta variegata TaxID=151549 RepID=A0A4C1VYB8_EUMVA|nr:hypothetical protein EVAR_85182_1 [Eumeta japonica]